MTLPTHLPEHLRNGRIFPAFSKSLVGIGSFCDVDFKFLFCKDSVTVYDPVRGAILAEWRELHSAGMWQFSLLPKMDDLPPTPPGTTATMLYSFSAYDLPSI